MMKGGTNELARFFRHHEIARRTCLGEYGLRDYLVVAGVAGVVPVFYHCAPHGASFPPIVRRVEKARLLACLIAGVVGHHSICYSGSSAADGV